MCQEGRQLVELSEGLQPAKMKDHHAIAAENWRSGMRSRPPMYSGSRAEAGTPRPILVSSRRRHPSHMQARIENRSCRVSPGDGIEYTLDTPLSRDDQGSSLRHAFMGPIGRV